MFLDVFQDNNFTDLKRQPTASVAQSRSVTKEDPEPKIVQKEAAIETSTQEKVEENGEKLKDIDEKLFEIITKD